MKEVFLDIGELGWSLYLSAHMRWLKHTGQMASGVMVLPGRGALYNGLVKNIFFVPDEFFTDFNMAQQNRFAFQNVNGKRLREYFDPELPEGYFVSRTQPFDCHEWKKVYAGQMIFKPYVISKPCVVNKSLCREIFVFPRCRKSRYFSSRNLPKAFYVALINRLCDEFKDCLIRLMGTKNGAYDINEIKKTNYVNFLGGTSLGDLIESTQFAIGAIGGQSAPLKLMLLQGVPTFMIGHERYRHIMVENWAKTRVGFYEINKNGYNDFFSFGCINNIVRFLKNEKEHSSNRMRLLGPESCSCS